MDIIQCLSLSYSFRFRFLFQTDTYSSHMLCWENNIKKIYIYWFMYV